MCNHITYSILVAGFNIIMRFIVLPLYLLLLILPVTLYAKTVQDKLDSLLNVEATLKSDTNKVWVLHEISYKYFQINPEKGIEYGEKALTLAQKLDYPEGIAAANKAIGRCYAIQNNYSEALRYFNTSLSQARKLNDKELEGTILISIGNVYHNKNDHNKALEYLEAATNIYKATGNDTYLPHIFNSIGNIYDDKFQSRKALAEFLEGLKIEEAKDGVSGIEATLNSNIGLIYSRLFDYENAFKYLFRALQLQKELGNDKSVANTLNSIGGIYLQTTKQPGDQLPDSLKNERRNIQLSIKYLQQAAIISNDLNRKNTLSLVYKNLSESYEANGDYQASLKYHRQYKALHDSLRNIDEERKFARVEAEFTVKKKTDSLKYANELKDEEIARSKTIRNSSMLMFGLIGFIGILFINRQHIKRKKLVAEKQLADNKLQTAQQRLNSFTETLKEKNRLIENFTEEIERLQALPCSNELPDTKEKLEKLQNSIILTEEQWIDFKQLYEEVHGDYLDRLKQKLPNLTQSEVRYMALSKLQLSNKEMAGMLGIGLSGMRNYKYRLRKKLNIKDDDDFQQLVESI